MADKGKKKGTRVLKKGKTVLGVPIPAGTKVKIYKEPKHIWTPDCREQSREHFWHPYSWKRTGVGMSKIYEEDLAEHYRMKGKKLRRFTSYGLEKGNVHVPLRISLEFDDFYMTLDRAVHNMGDIRFYDVETGKQKPIKQPWTYTIVRKDEKAPDPFSGEKYPYGHCKRNQEPPDFFKGEKFPYGYRVKNGESTSDSLEDRTVSKFIVHGNHTLAVGVLPTNVELVFTDDFVVVIGAVFMDKKAINKVLGRKCAQQIDLLYSMRIEAGKYKE